MRSVRYVPVAAAVAIAVFLVGCGGAKGGSGGKLEGINWALQSITEQGQEKAVNPEFGMGALFENGRVSGSSGVNTYTAPYELSGADLTIGMAATTMMAGPEELMELEREYLAALQESSTFTASGGSLTIFDKDGNEILSYVEEEAPALAGTDWIVTGYNNGKEAVVSPISGSELTALFDTGGKVSGSSGVNTFSGQYSVDGIEITIGPLASTMMASSDPALAEQEAAYLAALQSAARYTIRGGKLELRRDDGALAVSFSVK
ncbi:MAG: META domain-containing protein [Actinomycetota bacterium]